jgi:hypothetical protein
MLKLFGIRSWIGLMAVLVAAGGIVAMHDRLSAWWTSGQSVAAIGKDDGDWRQRELAFLKQLYDRLEAERAAQPGRAPASLREEQETILHRMEQVANATRGKIPPEIRAVLRDQPAAEAEKPPAQAAPIAPAAALPPVELRIGSAPFPRRDLDINPLNRDPELDRALERVQKIRAKPPPAKPAESKPNPTATEPAEKPKR